MRCFMCKIPLVVATLSIRSQNQPEADIENGYAHFCDRCTSRLDAAIDDSQRYPTSSRRLLPGR